MTDSENNTNTHPLEQMYEDNPYYKSKFENFLSAFFEIVIYIVSVLISVVIIRYFFIAPFSVEGSSMEPNLHDAELIIINKIGYLEFLDFKVGEPERGDIVVIIPPNDTSKFYVKRIIGLPNDTLDFTNGEIVVKNNEYPNGVRLDEKYLSEDNNYTSPPGSYRNKTVTLGDREYYTLGDNRNASRDSRSFGPVNRANIIGKVWFVGFPLDKFRVVSHNEYLM